MINKIAHAALWIAALALLGMVVVEGWQVLARYVCNDAPSWTEPCVLVLINTAMMFSAAVAVHRQHHFGFAIFAERAGPRIKPILIAFTPLVVVMIGVALCGYGAFMVVDAWPVQMLGTSLRQGVLYAPVTLGGALMVLFAGQQLLTTITHEAVPAVTSATTSGSAP